MHENNLLSLLNLKFSFQLNRFLWCIESIILLKIRWIITNWRYDRTYEHTLFASLEKRREVWSYHFLIDITTVHTKTNFLELLKSEGKPDHTIILNNLTNWDVHGRKRTRSNTSALERLNEFLSSMTTSTLMRRAWFGIECSMDI